MVRYSESDECVGRIRTVPPANVEIFALRLILLHKPVHSYGHAKQNENITHETFRSAASAMGLHIDGDEFEKAFDEAVSIFSTPSELRYVEWL